MKDSKFIELLNLYVDHEINTADAALLEAEIQQSPERRRIYREYCQMQKACVTLAETFRTQAPAADGSVVAFPGRTRRRLKAFSYAVGAIAAAACIALVAVNRSPLTTPAAPDIRPEDVAVQVPVTPAKAEVAPVQLKPAFVGLVRTDRPAANAGSLATSDRVALDWMHQVNLQRVPAEDLWFQSRPTLQPEDLMLRSRRTFQGDVEMTAFRFQK